MAVIEMGANHPGEIQSYCDVVLPDYGYITNFGRVHLEGFGSLQGVIQSKTELYRHLESRGKMVFINTSDPVQMERSKSMQRVLIGGEGGDCKVEFIDADPYVRMSFEGREIRSQLIGAYNYGNMAAAACIGRSWSQATSSVL
jgi:UDP-N-acetylmuramoyl-tripeptide--D-alanyl-D-alanine ligase